MTAWRFHWPLPPASRRPIDRQGFSLLELLLALAILGGSLAILSQIADTGISAAREARDLAVARLICQAKMAEVMMQNITPSPIAAAPVDPVDSASLTDFTYSVDVQPGAINGLLVLQVSVEAVNPNGGPPLASYSLVRWMIDPALGLEEAEMEEQAAKDAAAAAEETL